MLVNQLLSFWAQSEVCDHYIAFVLQEDLSKAEIDAFANQLAMVFFRVLYKDGLPEPAPVIRAVLPSTLKGADVWAAAMLTILQKDMRFSNLP